MDAHHPALAAGVSMCAGPCRPMVRVATISTNGATADGALVRRAHVRDLIRAHERRFGAWEDPFEGWEVVACRKWSWDAPGGGVRPARRPPIGRGAARARTLRSAARSPYAEERRSGPGGEWGGSAPGTRKARPRRTGTALVASRRSRDAGDRAARGWPDRSAGPTRSPSAAGRCTGTSIRNGLSALLSTPSPTWLFGDLFGSPNAPLRNVP